MRDIAEIKSELQDLDARLRKLESAQISGEGITAGDILYLTSRQEALRGDIKALEARIPSGDFSQASPVPQRVPVKKLAPPRESVREQRGRSRLNERVLGKYLVGVLASVLVLLAAGVLIAAVWQEIPDIAKFGMLILAGAALEAVGAHFVKKAGAGNGFWTSVTGLGAGVCFMALAAGCLVWHLYPMAAAGLAGILWFGVQFLVASRFGSWPFYTVAYLGGVLAIWLSAPAEILSLYDEIPIVFMAGAILLIGMAGSRFQPRLWLPGMNAVLASLAAYKIRDCMMGTGQWEINAPYRPWLSALAVISLAFLALIQAHRICPTSDRPGKWKKLWDVILILCAAGQLAMHCDVLDFCLGISGEISLVLCFLLLSLAIFLARGCWNRMLLGETPALMAVAAALSEAWLEEAALLPCLAAFGLAAFHKTRNGGRLARLTVWMWAMAAVAALLNIQTHLWRVGDTSSMGLVCATLSSACFAMGAGVALYRGIRERGEGWWQEIELFLAMGVIVLGLASLANFLCDIDTLPVLVVAAGLLYHRWAVMRKRNTSGAQSVITVILWMAAAVLTCGYAHILMLFADDLEQSLGILVLLAFSCSSVCAAIVTGSRLRTAFAMILANWTLFFVGNIVIAGLVGLAVSVMGLLLAAGFIVLGFWKKSKDMRLLGLGFMILYVLKISLFDVQGSSGIFGTAGGLLLGGLVCFGVSFAYNRIDRLYDRSDAENTGTEN